MAVKNIHEIRDPIHVFIKLDSQERRFLDSPPFQRLRYIHQLAMTYLVYPGATHRRFEHSLGVMELAGRVYDVITNPEVLNLTPEIRDRFPETTDPLKRLHWRKVLRLAALCHDIGHLPFSHAAEKHLMPDGWDHERMTRELIVSPAMQEIWSNLDSPKPDPEEIVKLALGPKKAKGLTFTDWETLLAEIIVGDAFGVDRMDYLLRDSLHTGVAYGKFDHFRLIDTMRILPPPEHRDEESSSEPCIGVESGGLLSAEALLLARYFMFSQVYFHSVRRIYDIHLKDFLSEWIENGCYPTDPEQFLTYTDAEIVSAMRKAAKDEGAPGHIHAKRIINRNHFHVLHEGLLSDIKAFGGTMAEKIAQAAIAEFGEDKVRYDTYLPKDSNINFPVRERNGKSVSARSMSQALNKIPDAVFEYVFVEKDILSAAKTWFDQNRESLLTKSEAREEEE